jgi:RHH-type proline utilization regulon transcriptional repressor/proline dehydrogenase/delta 1-pyrroline-5-carboxylate dehydrogenase
VIRTAVGQAMREMGRQFVLGQTSRRRWRAARAEEAKGYTYSYDMLGEAAMTGPTRPLRPRLCRRHRGARRLPAARRRSRANPGHLGQAVGAASALRGRAARAVMDELVPRCATWRARPARRAWA